MRTIFTAVVLVMMSAFQPAAIEEGTGYILRTGGKGTVVVIRKGEKIDVTGKRGFILFAGDDIVTEKDAWVEYYLSINRRVIREPATKTDSSVPGAGQSGERKAARSIVAARRQGSPPPPANRLFAVRESPQHYYLPADGRIRLSAVTVSEDVKPTEVTLLTPQGRRVPSTRLSPRVESKKQLHRLTFAVDEATRSNLKQFEVRVRFSDGSEDTAKFEVLLEQSGAQMKLDQLRRAAIVYERLKPENDEWFLALNDLALAFEELGCDAQAANLVVDWWFHEPDNPSAQNALLGLAIPFELGAVDKLFGCGTVRAEHDEHMR